MKVEAETISDDDTPRDMALESYAIANVHLVAMRGALVDRRYLEAANDLSLALVHLARIPAHLVSAERRRR